MWNWNRCLLNFLSAESSAITQRYISLLISLKIEMQKNTLKMIIYGAYIKWRTFDASAENWILQKLLRHAMILAENELRYEK